MLRGSGGQSFMFNKYHLAVLATLCCLYTSSAAAANERVLGVVPQGAPTLLASQWQPLVSHLQSSTHLPLHFGTASTISDFEERVLRGDYDYIYVNPLLFLRLQKEQGYRALVSRKNRLTGILVAATDAPDGLGWLKGKTIAFPSPHALGATLLIRSELKRHHIPHNVSYVGTHHSGYQGILVGRYPAAGGVMRTFELLPEASRSKLRIILQTPTVIGHIIAAHPRVPKKESDRIAAVLKEMNSQGRTRDILKNIRITGFIDVHPGNFATLQAMSFPTETRLKTLNFHVIPRLNEKDTERQMSPLISYIHQQLELELKLKTYGDMPKFGAAIARETEPALINANPLQALELMEKGYRVIAQQTPVNSPEGMRGVILVRQGSPYKKLSDLEGRKIAFGGSDKAFFASVVPRVLLSRAGLHRKYIDLSEPGSVDDVVRRLKNGEIDAAGTGTMARYSLVLKEKYGIDTMPVIAKSEPMPGLTWLLSKNVSKDIGDELQSLLLRYDPNAPGHEALTAAGIAGLRPVTIKSFEPIKRYIAEAKKLK